MQGDPSLVSPIAIAYVTDTWRRQGGGGAEKALFSLISGLDRRQFRPLLVSVAGDGSSDYFRLAREAGVPTVLLPMTLREGRCRSASNFLRLVRLLRRHRVRIVHSTQDQGAGILAGAIVGVGARLYTTHCVLPTPSMQRYLLSRAVVAHAASRNIAVSQVVSGHLVDRYRVDPARVTVIYNGVRAAAGTRLDAAVQCEAERRDAPPTVVSVGRLSWEKGVDILLDAMAVVVAQVGGARLIVVGDGPERTALECRAADLGISDSVRFVGHQTEIASWLNQATVLAMPSRSEGMGMSAAEALAYGIPVVCSGAGGLPEVVEDGRCGTVVAGPTIGEAIEVDPRALAEALLVLLTDRDRAQRLGANGKARYDALFTEEEFLRRHVETYLDELERTRRRRARSWALSSSTDPCPTDQGPPCASS